MKVKICGITNKEDAVWAINYGADFLGLNFWKESPRHVSVASAGKWRAELPPFASVVGVFVNADQKEIVDTAVKFNLKGVQLHGDESPEAVAALRVAIEGAGRSVFITKAFRMENEESLNSVAAFGPVADYFLLDAHVPDQPGGTGTVFNWDLAVRAKDFGKPIFLAGGLTPQNVKQAVKKVQPFGVDVASGVEKSPHRKDPALLKEFIQNAK